MREVNVEVLEIKNGIEWRISEKSEIYASLDNGGRYWDEKNRLSF